MTVQELIAQCKSWAEGTAYLQYALVDLTEFMLTQVYNLRPEAQLPDDTQPVTGNVVTSAIAYMQHMQKQNATLQAQVTGMTNSLQQLREWVDDNGYGPCEEGFVTVRTIGVLRDLKRQVDALTP